LFRNCGLIQTEGRMSLAQLGWMVMLLLTLMAMPILMYTGSL
jgi:hypothetical protein